MTDLSKDIWNIAVQPLKTSYLYYHNAYGHQGGDLPRGASAHKIASPFDHVAFWDHVKKKNHYSSTIIVPVTTKLAMGVTYFQVLQTKKSYNALIMCSLLCHVTNENHYIFSTRVPMATKLGRLLSYLNGFPPIESHHVKN